MVVAALNAMPGIDCDLPMGAFYVFPSCQGVLGLRDPAGQLISTDKELCMYFLRSVGVAVAPGLAFELPGHFRVSYASSDQELEDAMSRIAQAIARLS